MSERIVNVGDGQKLDIESGNVYDAQGNQVDRWAPTENKLSEAIAIYCSEFAAEGAAAAMRPEQGRQFLASWRSGLGGKSVAMDLGPSDVHLPSALPNYAAGYRNEPPMADVVSAPLIVNKPSDKFFTFAKEDAFTGAAPILGVPGGQVAEIAPRLLNSTYTTTEYALGGFVSTQVEAAADAPLKIRQALAKRVMEALTIEREKRVAALMGVSGSWDASVVTTLGGTQKWNGGSAADPIKDLLDLQTKSWGGVSGILMSQPVWNAFVQNTKVQDFLKYKDAIAPIPAEDAISRAFGLPPIYVSKMRTKNSSGGLSYVWGNNVVLFRSPEQNPPATQDDVASSYTFRWNLSGNSDGSVQGGFLVREYYVQDRGSRGGNKLVVLHNDAEVQTSAFVGGLLIGAVQ